MAKTLYVSDLDGTLLGSGQRVSERSCRIINRLTAEGMCFTLATARSLVTTKKVIAGLEGRLPLIIYNGVFVRDNGTGEILDAEFIPAGAAREAVDWFAARGIYPIVYSYIDGAERSSYVPGLCGEGVEAHMRSRGADDPRTRAASAPELYDGDIFYMTAIGDESLGEAYRHFSEQPSLNCYYQRDIYAGNMWLELTSARASKAQAARRVMKMTGCDRMVCFGDAVNDMPMFELADECYAVENADPRLKEIATGVIGSNDEDAVALWLEKYAKLYRKTQ